MPEHDEGRYEFGPFRLDPAQQQLFENGSPIPLTPKAFDTLLVLVRNHGRLVSKEELLQTVWPDAFVEESSLSQNVFRLRKLLGDTRDDVLYIETVPKRGYRFVADVRSVPLAVPLSRPEHARAADNGPEASSEAGLPEVAGRKMPSGPRWGKRFGVAAALVACLLTAIGAINFSGWGERLFEGSASPIRSLAVLPLENISGDPEQEYFADGLTEALITDLAQIGSVRVVSRTSVMQYKRVHKPIPQIARELGVDAVIEGTVLRSGDRVRITAQLIRARNERHLWAQMYDRSLGDSLSVQRQIAATVAEQVKWQLSPKERAYLSKPRPVDPEAYDLYLRGRYYWNRRDPEGLKKSLEFFQRALEKDPGFALGYVGLADYYIVAVDYMPRASDSYVPAREASLKALQLDEDSAEAHASLAFVHYQFDWNWEAAEKEFRRSIELSPGYATAHHWYGVFLGTMGRCDESLKEFRTAQLLDPLSLMIRTDRAATYYWCRQTDTAISELTRVVEMSPDFVRAHLYLAIGYGAQGKCDAGMAEYRKGLELSGGTRWRTVLAYEAYLNGRCGQIAQSRQLLNELRQEQVKQPTEYYQLAVVDAVLGDRDTAFRDLAEAEQNRSNMMVMLKVDPLLDPLRSDPRFERLLRQMKLSG